MVGTELSQRGGQHLALLRVGAGELGDGGQARVASEMIVISGRHGLARRVQVGSPSADPIVVGVACIAQCEHRPAVQVGRRRHRW